MLQNSVRLIYLSIGWLSFALGVIGLFLPLLPTTPFLILTAFCFSKGSDRLHQWLLALPHVGTSLRDWELHGVIKLRSKVMACGVLAASIGSTIAFANISPGLKIMLGLIGLSASIFITTRPSYPKRA